MTDSKKRDAQNAGQICVLGVIYCSGGAIQNEFDRPQPPKVRLRLT